MEHVFGNNDRLPMHFIVSAKDKVISFASDDLVMEKDTVSGNGIKGTIKEVLEERPARGNWKKLGHVPTFYKVSLFSLLIFFMVSSCRVARYKKEEKAAYERQLILADSARIYDLKH